MNAATIVPAGYQAPQRDVLAAARDEQADGATFESIFRRSTEGAGPAAQQRNVRRNLSTDADRLRRTPNATDMAVHELATQPTPKATVAQARAEQVGESGEPREEASLRGESQPAHAQTSTQDVRPQPASTPARESGTPNEALSTPSRAAAPSAAEMRSDGQPSQDQPAREASATAAPLPAPTGAGQQPPTESAATAAVRTVAATESTRSDATPRATAPVGEVRGTAGGPRSASPSATRPSTPPGSQAEKLMAQFGRGLAAALRQNGGTVTIRLQPQELGDLKIRMQMANGRIDARFEAATDEAREILNKNLGSLKTALETRGLTVDRLDVHSVARPGSTQTHSDRSHDHSGPGFADDQSHFAGGEPGGHGWQGTGAEHAGGGIARDFASRAAAEPVEELQPDRGGIAPGRAMGGAPTTRVGLDAVA